MKNCKLVVLALMISASQASIGQSNYKTGFDTEQEKAGWKEYTKGKITATWSIGSGGTNGSDCLSHSAPTGDANKDSLVNWYVSPKFDFSQGGSLDSLKYNYFTAFNSHFPEQFVQVYLLEGNPDPSLATKKTLLLDLSDFYYGNNTTRDTVWKDTGDIAIDQGSSNAYIAFKFVAVDGWSTIYFDDIYITTNKTNSIESIASSDFNVYPNPSRGIVHITMEEELQNQLVTLKMFNVEGKQVVSQQIDEQSFVNVNLDGGLYFYFIQTDKGRSVMQKIVIH